MFSRVFVCRHGLGISGPMFFPGGNKPILQGAYVQMRVGMSEDGYGPGGGYV